MENIDNHMIRNSQIEDKLDSQVWEFKYPFFYTESGNFCVSVNHKIVTIDSFAWQTQIKENYDFHIYKDNFFGFASEEKPTILYLNVKNSETGNYELLEIDLEELIKEKYYGNNI